MICFYHSILKVENQSFFPSSSSIFDQRPFASPLRPDTVVKYRTALKCDSCKTIVSLYIVNESWIKRCNVMQNKKQHTVNSLLLYFCKILTLQN